ncbi:MAG: tRNA lysidine(34) synthetase TilS [Terriglobales bacterium]
MRDRLVEHIRQKELMRAGERVGVAVSGGADSVALLRLLLEACDKLGLVLSVVHFNHKLRGEESEADEGFVRSLAAEYGLEFFCESGDTRAYAASRKCGIEAAAREMRYGFFWSLMRKAAAEGGRASTDSGQFRRGPGEGARNFQSYLDRVATAHTLDDQAETVVLRFARGAGTRGLAGIYPVVRAERPIVDCRLKPGSAERAEENKRSLDSGGQSAASARDDKAVSARDDKSHIRVTGETPVLRSAIVRPLLEFRRAQLRHYLKRAQQPWREDASNQDTAFARNRVRQEVMPKLRQMNPAVEMVLGETAEIARAEEEYWGEVVKHALRDVTTEKAIVDCRLQSNSAEDAEGQRETKGPSTPARKTGAPPLGKTNVGNAPPLGMTNVESAASLGMTKPWSVDISKLKLQPVALRRRVLREFAERQGLRLEFHHVEQVLEVASNGGGRSEKRVELTEGWDACIVQNRLRLEKRAEKKEASDYELTLPVPGEVRVEAAEVVLRARGAESGKRLRKVELRVRNWRPGDRYWPAHSGSEKKVKELLQDRRVPAERRASWPVVVCGDDIVWVPGFDYPEKWVTEAGEGIALEVDADEHF